MLADSIFVLTLDFKQLNSNAQLVLLSVCTNLSIITRFLLCDLGDQFMEILEEKLYILTLPKSYIGGNTLVHSATLSNSFAYLNVFLLLCDCCPNIS